MKVLCNALKKEKVTAAVTITLAYVLLYVPVPFYPTLSMTVSVQLGSLDTTAQNVSHEKTAIIFMLLVFCVLYKIINYSH